MTSFDLFNTVVGGVKWGDARLFFVFFPPEKPVLSFLTFFLLVCTQPLSNSLKNTFWYLSFKSFCTLDDHLNKKKIGISFKTLCCVNLCKLLKFQILFRLKHCQDLRRS